jgi:hypothetical protein
MFCSIYKYDTRLNILFVLSRILAPQDEMRQAHLRPYSTSVQSLSSLQKSIKVVYFETCSETTILRSDLLWTCSIGFKCNTHQCELYADVLPTSPPPTSFEQRLDLIAGMKCRHSENTHYGFAGQKLE